MEVWAKHEDKTVQTQEQTGQNVLLFECINCWWVEEQRSVVGQLMTMIENVSGQ